MGRFGYSSQGRNGRRGNGGRHIHYTPLTSAPKSTFLNSTKDATVSSLVPTITHINRQRDGKVESDALAKSIRKDILRQARGYASSLRKSQVKSALKKSNSLNLSTNKNSVDVTVSGRQREGMSKSNNQIKLKNKISTNATPYSNQDSRYCLFFNRFGRCRLGDKCTFEHDPSKRSVCRSFLQGECNDDKCLLSHVLDPEKMPMCAYFLKGTCSKTDCPYRHVKVSDSAGPCADFQRGHCPRGLQCTLMHIYGSGSAAAGIITTNDGGGVTRKRPRQSQSQHAVIGSDSLLVRRTSAVMEQEEDGSRRRSIENRDPKRLMETNNSNDDDDDDLFISVPAFSAATEDEYTGLEVVEEEDVEDEDGDGDDDGAGSDMDEVDDVTENMMVQQRHQTFDVEKEIEKHVGNCIDEAAVVLVSSSCTSTDTDRSLLPRSLKYVPKFLLNKFIKDSM
eukprot:gene987-1926_t